MWKFSLIMNQYTVKRKPEIGYILQKICMYVYIYLKFKILDSLFQFQLQCILN